jgi:hypothetical protein
MATLRTMNRENRKVHLELPADIAILNRWAGTMNLSTLGGQMNITAIIGHTAPVNTRWTNEHDNNLAQCTCQEHQGTMHVSTTPGHNTRVNTSWAYEYDNTNSVHYTCQH